MTPVDNFFRVTLVKIIFWLTLTRFFWSMSIEVVFRPISARVFYQHQPWLCLLTSTPTEAIFLLMLAEKCHRPLLSKKIPANARQKTASTDYHLKNLTDISQKITLVDVSQKTLANVDKKILADIDQKT